MNRLLVQEVMNMKRLFGYVLVLALVIGGCPSLTRTTYAQGLQINFNFFFHRLSPYGRWVYIPRYGQVWYPIGLGPYWQPYTNGHWIYTNFGWTWVSYDEFGWITFHYGAWTWFSPFGWVWVPGYVWGPAWVTWRYGPRYIGWAPLPPDYRFYFGSYCPPVRVIERAWVFVPLDDIGAHNIGAIRVPAYRNVEFFRATREITNIKLVNDYVVNSGPDDLLVERVRQIRVRQADVKQFNITPQPLSDLPASREITITKPYKFQTVPDSAEDGKGDRPLRKERFDDAPLKPGGTTGDHPFGERPFDSRDPTPKLRRPPRDGRSYDSRPGQEVYLPKPRWSSPEARPFGERNEDKGFWPKSDKPSRSSDQGGDYQLYPHDKFSTRVSPYLAHPKARSETRSSEWFDPYPESWRTPGRNFTDRPKAQPNTPYGLPSKIPSPNYDALPQRYSGWPDGMKPGPLRPDKSKSDLPVYRYPGDGPTKTPRYIYRPQMKSAPARPTSPIGIGGARAGSSVKRGKL